MSGILVVEDSDDDFRSFCAALMAEGVVNPVHRCASGVTALRALESKEGCGAARQAGLIFLDLNIPGVHGRELLERYRSTEKNIPVVVLSTSSHHAEMEACYRAGASDYVVKPLDFDDLCERLGAVVARWLGGTKPLGRRGGR